LINSILATARLWRAQFPIFPVVSGISSIFAPAITVGLQKQEPNQAFAREFP
jgi:hypothetical protein